MRTSLSRTTGSGVPTGTSKGIAADEPAMICVALGLFACPKHSPADKKIKRIGETVARIKFVLLFLVAQASACATKLSISPGGNAKEQRCKTVNDRCMEGPGPQRASSAAE